MQPGEKGAVEVVGGVGEKAEGEVAIEGGIGKAVE